MKTSEEEESRSNVVYLIIYGLELVYFLPRIYWEQFRILFLYSSMTRPFVFDKEIYGFITLCKRWILHVSYLKHLLLGYVLRCISTN